MLRLHVPACVLLLAVVCHSLTFRAAMCTVPCRFCLAHSVCLVIGRQRCHKNARAVGGRAKALFCPTAVEANPLGSTLVCNVFVRACACLRVLVVYGPSTSPIVQVRVCFPCCGLSSWLLGGRFMHTLLATGTVLPGPPSPIRVITTTCLRSASRLPSRTTAHRPPCPPHARGPKAVEVGRQQQRSRAPRSALRCFGRCRPGRQSARDTAAVSD